MRDALYLASVVNGRDAKLRKKRSVVPLCCHTYLQLYRSAIQPRRKERSSAQCEPESTCDFEADPGGPRDCSTPLYSALLRSTSLHSALLRSTPLHSAPLRPASKFHFIFQDFRQPPGLKTTKNNEHDTKRAPKTRLNRANRPGGGS